LKTLTSGHSTNAFSKSASSTAPAEAELDEEPEDLLPLIFLVGTVVFFADAALEGAAVDSLAPSVSTSPFTFEDPFGSWTTIFPDLAASSNFA